MNLITICIDSLRWDHVGINGNSWVNTPNLDKLGAESIRFDNAYPESLPTIPVRRTLATGQRCYPYRDWVKPFKPAPIPGWTPLEDKPDIMSEILQERGYVTALISDLYHLFRPGMNFTRGYDEWQFFHGQEWDVGASDANYKPDLSPFTTPRMAEQRSPVQDDVLIQYLRNVHYRMEEKDYFPAKVFTAASEWLVKNYKADKFFLNIECFDPHEPWDPPQYYRDMYNSGYKGVEVILPLYTMNQDYMTDEELKHMRALYAAELTMVDHWLGYFLETVRQLGLMENTIIALYSDHGHMLGEKSCVGKPPEGMFPELMDLVFFLRKPGQKSVVVDKMVSNLDIFPTLFHALGEDIPEQAQGINLFELVNNPSKPGRNHVTCILKNCYFVRDEHHLLLCKHSKEEARLFALDTDPKCEINIADKHPDIVDRLYDLLVEDGGGDLPVMPVPKGFANRG